MSRLLTAAVAPVEQHVDPEPFVGRDRELRALDGAVRAAREEGE